jgi:dTDP-4-amino-4,6-dideoxygalactose transaminase
MIPFSPPRIDEKTLQEVREALLSGWITTGPRTKLFEKKINEYIGAKTTICFNSATAGMELVLRWFGIKEGDEVIIPAYTYCATGNIVLHCGAKPVMVDVNEDDFNISIKNIRAAITPKTKVILAVDIAGYPCDYDEIMALVKEPSIKNIYKASTPEQEQLGRIMVFADAAHSFGAIYKGKTTGTLADGTAFSFHAVKNLTTAEGGSVSFNLPDGFDHEAIYKTMNMLSLHGQSKDALSKAKLGGWRYDVLFAGYKCNMTDLQAAIGLVEIDRYNSETLTRRKEIFDAYSLAFLKYKWAKIPVYYSKDKTTSYHLYQLRINNITEDIRDKIIDDIAAAQVAVNVHFIPLPMLTVYKKEGYRIEDYPQTYKNYAAEISLPVYYDLTNEQVNTVILAVVSAVEKNILKN